MTAEQGKHTQQIEALRERISKLKGEERATLITTTQLLSDILEKLSIPEGREPILFHITNQDIHESAIIASEVLGDKSHEWLSRRGVGMLFIHRSSQCLTSVTFRASESTDTPRDMEHFNGFKMLIYLGQDGNPVGVGNIRGTASTYDEKMQLTKDRNVWNGINFAECLDSSSQLDKQHFVTELFSRMTPAPQEVTTS